MSKWWVGLPDTSGTAKYVVIIRGKDDPTETKKRGHVENPGGVSWKEVDKHSPEEWRKRIVKLLTDGVPRTFNHIAVVLSGHTADVVFQKNPELGLWLAVERGELEYTNEAPILFRIRKRGAYDVPVSPTKASRGRVTGPKIEYVPPRAPPKPKNPKIRREITTHEAAREFEELRRGKTVKPAVQKRVRGFAIYDASTIKKQHQGQRVGMTLLLPGPRGGAPKTLDEARKFARDWTALTGHATTVKEDGIPIAHYNWDAEMSATYTKGWVRGKTAVTNGERFGIFHYARPSSGAADSGYLAGVVWDGEKGLDWVPLTSLTKTPTVPAKSHHEPRRATASTAGKVARERERRSPVKKITAEHFTDPVLGGAERRLAESVEEAIRLYGSPKKRR